MMVSLYMLYVFIWWDLLLTLLWGKLHPVPTTALLILIVTMISIRTLQYLRQTVSIGNRGFHGFILFPVSLIPVYHHRIWYFPVDGSCQEWVEVGGCMFLKKGMKKEKGCWYSFLHCFQSNDIWLKNF